MGFLGIGAQAVEGVLDGQAAGVDLADHGVAGNAVLSGLESGVGLVWVRR